MARAKRSVRSKVTRGKTTKQIATDAAVGVRQLKKVVHPETWEFDTSGVGQNPSFTPVITPLTALAQGDADGDRSGLSIYAKWIRLSYIAFANETNTTPQALRVMVFIDTSQNGATPAATDVLTVSGSLNVINSPQNQNNIPRFKVLYDKMHWLANDSNQALVQRRMIKIDRRVNYLGTSAASASLGKGTVYLLFVSSNSAQDQPSFSYYSRLTYLDN